MCASCTIGHCPNSISMYHFSYLVDNVHKMLLIRVAPPPLVSYQLDTKPKVDEETVQDHSEMLSAKIDKRGHK